MVAGSNLWVVGLVLVVFMAAMDGREATMWAEGDFMAMGKDFSSSSSKKCDGLIGECFMGDEMMMDSESNRRILATRSYISYSALRSDSVPCSKKGTSYYNCGSSGQANPYKRSCTAVTRCARDTS